MYYRFASTSTVNLTKPLSRVAVASKAIGKQVEAV